MENDPVATALGSVTRHQNRQADTKAITRSPSLRVIAVSARSGVLLLESTACRSHGGIQRALSATVSVFVWSPASSLSAARSAFDLGACMPVLSPSIQACTKKYLLPSLLLSSNTPPDSGLTSRTEYSPAGSVLLPTLNWNGMLAINCLRPLVC